MPYIGLINFSENDGQKVASLIRQFYYYVLLFSPCELTQRQFSLLASTLGLPPWQPWYMYLPPPFPSFPLSSVIFSLVDLSVSDMQLECPTLFKRVPLAMTVELNLKARLGKLDLPCAFEGIL